MLENTIALLVVLFDRRKLGAEVVAAPRIREILRLMPRPALQDDYTGEIAENAIPFANSSNERMG